MNAKCFPFLTCLCLLAMQLVPLQRAQANGKIDDLKDRNESIERRIAERKAEIQSLKNESGAMSAEIESARKVNASIEEYKNIELDAGRESKSREAEIEKTLHLIQAYRQRFVPNLHFSAGDSLGDLKLKDGKVLKNAVFTKFTDAAQIRHAKGFTAVKIDLLPDEIASKFSVPPASGELVNMVTLLESKPDTLMTYAESRQVADSKYVREAGERQAAYASEREKNAQEKARTKAAEDAKYAAAREKRVELYKVRKQLRDAIKVQEEGKQSFINEQDSRKFYKKVTVSAADHQKRTKAFDDKIAALRKQLSAVEAELSAL